MSYNRINLGEALAVAMEQEELSMEGFSDVLDYVKNAGDRLGNFIKTVFNAKTFTVTNYPAVDRNLIHKLNSASFESIKDLQAFTPAQLSSYIVDYSATLEVQVASMGDIVERIYVPLTKWLAKAATQEGYYEKAWIGKDLVLSDVNGFTKEMQKHFEGNANGTGDSTITKFGELYASGKQFESAHKSLTRLHELANNVDLDMLQEAEKRLMEVLTIFINAIDEEGGSNKLPKPTRKKLAQVFREIAAETEYLSMLLFQTNVVINAFNDTADTLKDAV